MKSDERKKRKETWKLISIVSVFVFLFGLLTLALASEAKKTYYYPLSYNPLGKAAIKEASNAQEFGEVFNPGFRLDEDFMFMEKVLGIPSPCEEHYFISYVNPDMPLGFYTKPEWHYALIQCNPMKEELTAKELANLVNSGSEEVLYGGFVEKFSCQNLYWDNLDSLQRQKLERISENQNFGDTVKVGHPQGFLSVMRVHNIPSECHDQTLVSYYVKTQYGYKNKKVLIQGDIMNHGKKLPFLYGGI
ncbi:hypothetical protein J5751_04530 [bacterium]|nr:hypothetical protein [bacterium]